MIKACCDSIRGNSSKLKESVFKLDIRKKCVTLRVVRHNNRLPRDVVAAPPLVTFKVELDRPLGSLI